MYTQLFVEIVPRISYGDVKAGLSESQRDAIRKTGVVVITGGVSKEVSALRYDTTDAVKRPEGSVEVEASNQRLHCSEPGERYHLAMSLLSIAFSEFIGRFPRREYTSVRTVQFEATALRTYARFPA